MEFFRRIIILDKVPVSVCKTKNEQGMKTWPVCSSGQLFIWFHGQNRMCPSNASKHQVQDNSVTFSFGLEFCPLFISGNRDIWNGKRIRIYESLLNSKGFFRFPRIEDISRTSSSIYDVSVFKTRQTSTSCTTSTLM